MNYIIDLIFAAFAIITVIVFAKRGFFLSLLKFFKLLLAFIAAHLWGDSLGKFLSDKVFYTPIRNSIFSKLNGIYEGATDSFNVETATNAIPQFLRTDAFMQKLNSLDESGEALVNSISDSVATALSNVICSVVGFLLVFVVAFLALTILYWILKGLRGKIPVVGTVDTLLGALLGAVFAFLILLAVGSVLKFFFGNDDFYTKSILIKFFGDSSILGVLKFLNVSQWLGKIGML